MNVMNVRREKEDVTILAGRHQKPGGDAAAYPHWAGRGTAASDWLLDIDTIYTYRWRVRCELNVSQAVTLAHVRPRPPSLLHLRPHFTYPAVPLRHQRQRQSSDSAPRNERSGETSPLCAYQDRVLCAPGCVVRYFIHCQLFARSLAKRYLDTPSTSFPIISAAVPDDVSWIVVLSRARDAAPAARLSL